MQIPDSTDAPVSLTAYAKRRGVSVMTVSRAAAKGRLRASVVRAEDGRAVGIRPELADREWAANSDYTDAPQRAPGGPLDPLRGSVKASIPPGQERLKTFEGGGPGDHAQIPDIDHPPEPEEGDGSIAQAADRQKHWQARIAELKFKTAAGDLVPAHDVAQRLVTVFTQCKTRLLGIPSRARQALPHLTIADIAALEGLVREALEDLAAEGEQAC